MYDLRFHKRLQLISDSIVIKYSRELGFDLIGFAPADKPETETAHLKEWLSEGYHAGMQYMERNIEKKGDPGKILPGARSIISLGINYYHPSGFSGNPLSGKISRYAQGKDYHLVIGEKLDELIALLKNEDPGFQAVSYVDTGPVMDKTWAVRSGLGWMGKHTNVINKESGSWFFIATIITNYDFSPPVKIEDFCGTCTACIDACPTGALKPYILDANKCISYLTIENKGDIPESFTGKFEGWIFGCDICQEVCPWNKKFSVAARITEFTPVNREISLDEISNMREDEFLEKFRVSPVKRAKLKGLKRNAGFLMRLKES